MFINDSVFDEGLDWLTSNVAQLDLCSDEPSSYTEATSTYTLGNDTVSAGAAANRSGGGFTFYSTGVIYIAETGVSGLTGAESTTLDKLNGTLDANVVEVNGVTVTGSGTELDPWGP